MTKKGSTKMDQPPQGFVLELWHAAVGIATAGAIAAWRFITGNIHELQQTTITKDDFKVYADHAQTQRDELRQAVIKLFDGQGELSKEINDTQKAMTETINLHYGELLKAIHEVRK